VDYVGSYCEKVGKEGKKVQPPFKPHNELEESFGTPYD
jgi:hypothetical protein